MEGRTEGGRGRQGGEGLWRHWAGGVKCPKPAAHCSWVTFGDDVHMSLSHDVAILGLWVPCCVSHTVWCWYRK